MTRSPSLSGAARTTVVLVAAASMLAACGNDVDESGSSSGTDTAVSANRDTVIPMKPDTGYVPGSGVSFEESVHRQYARLAVGLSRHEMDSIMQNTNPAEIEQRLTERLHVQDTIARGALADKYSISRDSVDAILSARNVPKR